MQLKSIAIMVDDQSKALAFYTNALGFEKMADFPVGQFRRLTVTAPISSDIHADFVRLRAAGVVFRGTPTEMGPGTVVSFEDPCVNLINLVQPA